MENGFEMAKVVTFGEIMLRLAPFDYERFVQANRLQATYGGGEANVAVSLAQFGHEVFYVTRVPDNPIGAAAIRSLWENGVKTEYVVKGGKRLGIYFLEHGASIRPSKVVYDRANSSISEIEKTTFDWEKIFLGKDWFHVTGITPALSANCAQATIAATEIAKRLGVTVSCDLNYRKNLWTKQQAGETMKRIVKNVDVLIANEEDAADVFGIEAETTDVISGKLDVKHYRKVAEQLREVSGAGTVAITLRESLSASDNNWSGVMLSGTEFFVGRKYPLHVIDRVGGGDAFSAGLIHGLISGWDKQKSLELAIAASALKHTIPGDFNFVTEAEVLAILKGDISGRVQR